MKHNSSSPSYPLSGHGRGLTHSAGLPLQNIPLAGGLIKAFSIDYRTLALFRVLMAVLILVDLAIRCEDFIAFFTDDGILQRSQILGYYGESTWSIYFLNGSPWFAGMLVLIAILAACAMMIGYRTRLAVIISWVLLVSMHFRNPLLSSGADDLMRVLLFWAMFLPLGARYSVDAALDRGQSYQGQNHFSAATVAILMQALYVYWAGALLKTGSEWTQDYTAVQYALSAEHYATWLGHWVVNALPEYLSLLTRFVYLIELYGPVLMVAPFFLLWFRLPVLGLLIAMHIGFLLMLNVGHFPYVSITSLLLFTPSAIWAWLARRRRSSIEIYYDEGCEFCLKTVLILKNLLLLPHAQVAPAQQDAVAGPLLKQHDSWVIRIDGGDYILEWQALTALVTHSPLFFWLAWPMRFIHRLKTGDRIYHWIGDRRMALGKVTAAVLPWRNRPAKEHWSTQIVVLLLAAMVLQINISYVSRVPALDSNLVTVRNGLGLWQKWNMFAPYPIRSTQWPIIEGIRADGSRVDLFRDSLTPSSTAKPDTLSYNFSSYRWRKYLGRLYLRKYHHYRRSYALFQCRRWNGLFAEQPEHQIVKVQILTGILTTVLPPDQSKPRITNQGTYSCR